MGPTTTWGRRTRRCHGHRAANPKLRDYRKSSTRFRPSFATPRARGGLLRGREFLMKDAYSFDVDEAGARATYERMRQAYVRIFDRLGLTVRMVEADSGAMGGSTSAEFQVLVDAGEDAIATCDGCDDAANLEAATARAQGDRAGTGRVPRRRRPAETPSQPGHGAIADVASLLNVAPSAMYKSLVYETDAGLVMAVVRGDHEVNEVRLARILGSSEVRLASEADVKSATGGSSALPARLGLRGASWSIARRPWCRAASQAPTKPTTTSATCATGGTSRARWWTFASPCRAIPVRSAPKELSEPIAVSRPATSSSVGTRYSEAMGATFCDESQQQRALVMGCYGLGVSRLVAAVVEQHQDGDGIRWPLSVAPYHVHLVTLGHEAPVLEAAEMLYAALDAEGVEVLWDDRDERAGVKFKDADLIGIPWRTRSEPGGFSPASSKSKRAPSRTPRRRSALPSTRRPP